MTDPEGVTLSWAVAWDVAGVCAFGTTHIPPHYSPLIGADAAHRQVSTWWNADAIQAAVASGRLLLARDADRLVGVAQLGWSGADPVIWKLYLDPGYRGQGIGADMMTALIDALPRGAQRICVEHFAGNRRAGTFYEREGFVVERIDPDPAGVPELGVVWRARLLAVPAGQ